MGVCRPKIRSAVGPGFGATVGSTGSVSAPGSVQPSDVACGSVECASCHMWRVCLTVWAFVGRDG